MSFEVLGKDFESKSISIDTAIDKVLDERRARQDFLVPISQASIGLNANDEIAITIDGKDFIPTEYCLKQLANVTKVSHAVIKQYTNPVLKQNGKVQYDRDRVDYELLVALFKNGLRDNRVNPEKKFRFRTYTDGTMRAMLTEQYTPLDNAWYLEEIKKIFKTIGGDEPRFVHWRGGADTLFGSLLIPDTCRKESDSGYGGMIGISNCEIGTRRLGMRPAVFRGVCTNGVFFGMVEGNSIRQVHRGNIDLNNLRVRIVTELNDQIPLLTSGIDSFLAMHQKTLSVEPSRMIAQIARDHNLSYGATGQAMEVANQYGLHESTFRSLFGIVNAITRTAQKYDPVEQIRLEEIGGILMDYDDNRWSNYNNRAKTIETDEYNKVFGLVS